MVTKATLINIMAVRGVNYNLRDRGGRNYREFSTVKLPRVSKVSTMSKLYPIEVVESDGSKVRIHYIGYDDSADEWRESTELVKLTSTRTSSVSSTESKCNVQSNQPIQQFSLYNELRIKIKQALVCGRKQSPLVVINMPFDFLLFKGGLQAAGKPKRVVNGNQHYQLKSYQDLDILLGPNWHFRGVNKHGDYAFVVLASVDYNIYKRQKLTEHFPSAQSTDNIVPTLQKLDTGYGLRFSFVRAYGNSSTFGKDKEIFKD